MEMGGLAISEEHACSELSVPGCYFKKGQLLQYFKKGHILNQRKALVRSLGSFHSFWVWKSTLICHLHLHSSVSAQALSEVGIIFQKCGIAADVDRAMC